MKDLFSSLAKDMQLAAGSLYEHEKALCEARLKREQNKKTAIDQELRNYKKEIYKSVQYESIESLGRESVNLIDEPLNQEHLEKFLEVWPNRNILTYYEENKNMIEAIGAEFNGSPGMLLTHKESLDFCRFLARVEMIRYLDNMSKPQQYVKPPMIIKDYYYIDGYLCDILLQGSNFRRQIAILYFLSKHKKVDYGLDNKEWTKVAKLIDKEKPIGKGNKTKDDFNYYFGVKLRENNELFYQFKNECEFIDITKDEPFGTLKEILPVFEALNKKYAYNDAVTEIKGLIKNFENKGKL